MMLEWSSVSTASLISSMYVDHREDTNALELDAVSQVDDVPCQG
jgi:hypothetical protein